MSEEQLYCIVCTKWISDNDTIREEYNLEDNICSKECRIIFYQMKPQYITMNKGLRQ